MVVGLLHKALNQLLNTNNFVNKLE